ncbi:MAG: hypothetical protein ACOX57_02345 [Limnochordia bacterium]|jgi:hypothetical protein|nr:hypothetical protein [Bacillota bacterium]
MLWALISGLSITCVFLWLLPLWLVWPVGVLFSIYLVTLIQRQRGPRISDEQILAVLVGAWLALCCGMWLFLVY